MTEQVNQLDLLSKLLELAKKEGAETADAVVFDAIA